MYLSRVSPVNVGYGFSSELAAGLIEAICGKPIDDVFQEMLFDPLEMGDTAPTSSAIYLSA